VASENPGKAALNNQLEQLRDPSHVRFLPLGELVALFGKAGLRDLRVVTYGTLLELAEWFAISKTPTDVAERVRSSFVASIPGDSTGMGVHLESGRIFFTHTFTWVVGTKN